MRGKLRRKGRAQVPIQTLKHNGPAFALYFARQDWYSDLGLGEQMQGRFEDARVHTASLSMLGVDAELATRQAEMLRVESLGDGAMVETQRLQDMLREEGPYTVASVIAYEGWATWRAIARSIDYGTVFIAGYVAQDEARYLANRSV